MLYFRHSSVITILLIFVACTAAPPARHTVSHDNMLNRQGGVLLLADVCIQKDAIGDADDFFVIAESKFAAEAILKELRTYVEDSSIPVRGEIPIVCAAKHGNQESIRVGDNFTDSARNASQPIYVQPQVQGDADYVDAISLVSTYAFERAALDIADNESEPKSVSKLAYLDASDVIRDRTQASSILFLGALGTSTTSAKAVTQGVSNFFVSLASGIATAGLGSGYYVMFTPGKQVSGRFLEGALIDLETGELTWSNAVKAGGDPIEPDTWTNMDPLDLLFHDLLFKRIETH